MIKDACLMGMPSRVGPVANLGLRRAIVSDGLVMPAGGQQQLWDGGFSEGPGGWNWRCRTPGPKVLTKHKGRDATKGKNKKDKKRTGSAKHQLLAIGSCRKEVQLWPPVWFRWSTESRQWRMLQQSFFHQGQCQIANAAEFQSLSS